MFKNIHETNEVSHKNKCMKVTNEGNCISDNLVLQGLFFKLVLAQLTRETNKIEFTVIIQTTDVQG